MQIVTYLGVVETFDISAREACHEGHAHDTHSAEPRPGSISGAQSQGTSYDTLGENVVVVGTGKVLECANTTIDRFARSIVVNGVDCCVLQHIFSRARMIMPVRFARPDLTPIPRHYTLMNFPCG